MSFSSSVKTVANNLLTSYGELITATRHNIATINPTTGFVIEETTTTFTGYGHPSFYDNKYIDSVNVLSSDIRLLFYSITAPAAGDIFNINGTNYNAVSVQQIRAQGVDIYYIVQLRQ